MKDQDGVNRSQSKFFSRINMHPKINLFYKSRSHMPISDKLTLWLTRDGSKILWKLHDAKGFFYEKHVLGLY